MTARIGIIDDHKGVRQSLCALLESADYDVCEFASAQEFLDGGTQCDGLVVDVQMPGMSGLELQEELVRRHSAVPVIVITGQADIALAVRAMRAGAFDVIEKPFGDDIILASIAMALSGRRTPVRGLDVKQALEMLALLTERERQVLDLLALGESNKIIGHQLGISTRTVEAHRAKVLEKMKARNVADLMRTLKVADALP